MKSLFLLSQYLIPHHLFSRFIGCFGASRLTWIKGPLIRRFIRAYGVDMSEAEREDPAAYASFNAFFTRALKPDARPIAAAPGAVASPADGVLSAIGAIRGGQLLQAKGREYSLLELLGGGGANAALFERGSFATVYLAPKDYHRVHMPCAGTLREMSYIPGRLFSVNQTTTDAIPRLFARNERVVCLFDTAVGPMAVILVGAMIVASIETVWAGRVAPVRPRKISVSDYREHQPAVRLERGEELGRFMMGSTVIVLFGPGAVHWSGEAAARWKVRMGQQLGSTEA